MSSIVYVQPVFAPDQSRLDRNIESIKSFANYIKEHPYPDLKIILGGWVQTDEYWNQIKETVRDYIGPGVPIKRFDRNYGKATVVNTLYKSKGDQKFDYMLTADSDIVFDANQPNLFKRCIEAANESVRKRNKPFGIMALNQMGQCCHLKEHVYQNRHKYQGSNGVEEIVWPRGNGGIAGGCLFTSTKCWEEIGGYRVMGVYSGDDAYYLIDANARGYSLQMFESGKIVHPHDHDQEYAQWKFRICQRDSAGGVRKNNINDKIAEADQFWNKKHKGQ